MMRHSIGINDYPSDIINVLSGLARMRGRTGGMGPESIRKITDPIGQLLFVAQRNGLDLVYNFATLAAYIEDIEHRPIKYTTKVTYMKGLRRLSVAMNWPKHLLDRIDAEIAFYRKMSRSEISEKERKLLNHPITLSDIGSAARHWFEIAQSTKNPTKRRSNFQRAAFLAFTSLVPNRVGDIQHFRVDEHVLRTRNFWFLSMESRKTSNENFSPLHADLTPYLDALIHYGEPDNFERMLGARSGTPLFSKADGSTLLRETLWRHFKIGTGGHSPHIVRTLTHDLLAGDTDPQSGTIARILCGQKSLETSAAYEVFAKRARFARAQDMLSKIQA